MSVIPQDRRKYKEGVIKELINTHSFAPKLARLTESLAKKREAHIIGMKSDGKPIDPNKKLTFQEKYDLKIYMRNQKKEQNNFLKQQLDQKEFEKEDCTF